jgi:hypothetical protein
MSGVVAKAWLSITTPCMQNPDQSDLVVSSSLTGSQIKISPPVKKMFLIWRIGRPQGGITFLFLAGVKTSYPPPFACGNNRLTRMQPTLDFLNGMA